MEPMVMHGDGYGWGMGTGFLFMLFLWVVIVAGSVLLVRWIISSGGKKEQSGLSSEAPLDILKKRYARGDITREQYEQIKKDIS